MDARTFGQVQQIMSLAMQLNPTKTERKITGNKPTVFVRFAGHTCGLYVEIIKKGWQFENNTMYETTFYLNENPYEELDEMIDLLEKLCAQWKDREVAS